MFVFSGYPLSVAVMHAADYLCPFIRFAFLLENPGGEMTHGAFELNVTFHVGKLGLLLGGIIL